jgi:hypothetical protein
MRMHSECPLDIFFFVRYIYRAFSKLKFGERLIVLRFLVVMAGELCDGGFAGAVVGKTLRAEVKNGICA